MSAETSDTETSVDQSQVIPTADTAAGKVILGLSVVISLLALYQTARQLLPTKRFDNLYLGLVFALFLLIEFYRAGAPTEWTRRQWVKLGGLGALMLGGLIGTIYIELNFVKLQTSYGQPPVFELLLGGLIILGVIVGMYWSYGWMITAVAILSITYARYGQLFPGFLRHAGRPWDELILVNVLSLNAGVYHLVFHIAITWIFIFILWAGIIEEFGGMETFLDIGLLIGSKFRSGAAQSAVISSMIMGSINGSPMANAASTGSFTIPLMKDRGISPQQAAGIEAVASTGGMVLPPVMSAVPFIMTSYLNVPYSYIISVAALPAILFYVAVALSVYLITRDVEAEPDPEMAAHVDRREILRDIFPVLISVIVLVYLLFERFSPGVAGVWTIVTLLVVEFLKRVVESGDRVTSLKDYGASVITGMRTGVVRMIPIAITISAVGVLITSFSYTGIGYRLSSNIVAIAGGNLFFLLALVMVSAMILGMGMPTVAAYLLVISLVAPAMVQVGFADITAHFFVFYFAMLAAITPPIALTPAVTCKIAECDFIDAAKESVILGVPIFLLPWVFAFNESLLLIKLPDTLFVFGATLIGYIIIVLGIHGNVSFRGLNFDNPAVRAALVIGGLFIVFNSLFIPSLS